MLGVMPKARSGRLKINHDSIFNALKGYQGKPDQAIFEYIWNGFDAGADRVDINYTFPQQREGVLMGQPTLEVVDDGNGWDPVQHNKLELFLASDKEADANKSLPHGRKGVGRCTFFVFAQQANWETVFNGVRSSFAINAEALDRYITLTTNESTLKKGTRITFVGIHAIINQDFFENTLSDALANEFAWFLLLYPKKKIYLNNIPVDPEGQIMTKKELCLDIGKFQFDIRMVQWHKRPRDERSKYYFINAKAEEVSKRTTGLNNKSDVFHHSVYVGSNFYSSFDPKFVRPKTQDRLIDDGRDEIHARLLERIREELTIFRKEYLRSISTSKIVQWKADGIFPKKEELSVQEDEYEEMVRDIFIAAPQLFSTTTDDQRRITLRMLASMLGTEGRDDIVKILDQVFRLSDEDKRTLAELLGRTSLSHIIRTTKDIERRIDTIASLEQLLFDPVMKTQTLEVKHLQKILDDNFWIFGEEYRLFATTEGSIRKTLIRLAKDVLKIDPDEILTSSKKELDLLLIKEDRLTGVLRNIVVEIKRPSVTLGKKELDQILQYKDDILKEPSCNGDGLEWEFILIGDSYDEHIADAIETVKTWGEKRRGLVQNLDAKRTKVYVRKWSDVINGDLKTKYKALFDQLQLQEKDLNQKSHADIVKDTTGKMARLSSVKGIRSY